MIRFNDLGLDTLLLRAITEEGYQTPTPIQSQAIPNILEGKDILGVAQTGTGKTAAFALPILQKVCISSRNTPHFKAARVLILSPTRELATQIGECFRVYGNFLKFSVAVIFGGVSYKPQREMLNRGVDILIATPGRLIDHLNQGNLSLGRTEIFVLDEADQMFDLGFIHSLRKIVSGLPTRRQSLFFSATMPHEISALAGELLTNPIRISMHQETKVADHIEQKVIFVDHMQKRNLLIEFFRNYNLQRAIVFTRTKRGADRVAKFLETSGIHVAAIHGDKSQSQRNAAIQDFKKYRVRALIATDIAARGIDIDSVSHIINYEIPNVPEIYVHRIGRTARAGAQGIAISFVDHEERRYLQDIERLTKQKISSSDRTKDPSLKETIVKQRSRKDDLPYAHNRQTFKKDKQKDTNLSELKSNYGNSKKFHNRPEQTSNAKKQQEDSKLDKKKTRYKKRGGVSKIRFTQDNPQNETAQSQKRPNGNERAWTKTYSQRNKRSFSSR